MSAICGVFMNVIMQSSISVTILTFVDHFSFHKLCLVLMLKMVQINLLF